MRKVFSILILTLLSQLSFAQQILFEGVVMDREMNEPIPFAQIMLPDSSNGTASGLDGEFIFEFDAANVDSVIFYSMGYMRVAVPIVPIVDGGHYTDTIYLDVEDYIMGEVVIDASYNPAHNIIEKAAEAKADFSIEGFSSYQYEAYTKIEIDVNNISEKFMERKIMKQYFETIDSLDRIYNENGELIIPIFFSETVSDFYKMNNPVHKKEIVKATESIGVAVEDGSLTAQLTGASLQEYNFNENWVPVFGKDFVSPIANSWKGYYKYFLADSIETDGELLYKIEFFPKRAHDLAFHGDMMISKKDYSIRNIDVYIDKKANLNFIERVEITQEYSYIEGKYMPTTTDILVDGEELSEKWTGMIAQYYSTWQNIEVNNTQPISFFDQRVVVEEDAMMKAPEYWAKYREDNLTSDDEKAFAMIDSVKNLPVVKSYVDIFYTIVNGHVRMGKIDVGPYLLAYRYNTLEGNRIRLGAKTNINFSRKFEFSGYGAYGFLDEEWKYGLTARYIASRSPWVELGAKYVNDIRLMGISTHGNNELFEAFSLWGSLNGPYYSRSSELYFFKQFPKGFSQKITLRNSDFNPLFNFSYFAEGETKTGFNSSEVIFETRYAKGEFFVQNDNSRLSLGTKFPVYTLRYTLGIKDFLWSDFNYSKLEAMIEQKVSVGPLGRFIYKLEFGKAFNTIPYPLLNVHLGNETPFLNDVSFSMMNYFEFVTDIYGSIKYEHHFDGAILNRIPLMKKLKWRLVANGAMLVGDINKSNVDLIPVADQEFSSLKGKPYFEVGYGIENIFKIFRVQAFHRLSHFGKAENFGVKGTVYFHL